MKTYIKTALTVGVMSTAALSQPLFANFVQVNQFFEVVNQMNPKGGKIYIKTNDEEQVNFNAYAQTQCGANCIGYTVKLPLF